jgi:hypothetical protein
MVARQEQPIWDPDRQQGIARYPLSKEAVVWRTIIYLVVITWSSQALIEESLKLVQYPHITIQVNYEVFSICRKNGFKRNFAGFLDRQTKA